MKASDVQPERPKPEQPEPQQSEAQQLKAEQLECPPAVPANRHILLVHQVSSAGRHGEISYDLFRELRDLLDEIESSRDETEIDLWIESPGGDAHAAYKIALLFRAKAHKLRVVVPDYAKSAATLLALAADEIFMAPAAELGPLDAQIGYEKEGMTISALDVARSLEDLAEKGISMVLSGGAAVLDTTKLPRAESLNAMVDFATKFMAPVIDKLDPTMIHWSTSLLNVSAQYSRRLLQMREIKYPVTSAALTSLPEVLAGRYPAHGFVISRNEARSLGLPVVDLEEYEYCESVVKLFRMLEEQRANVVRRLVPSQLAAGETPEEPKG